jgi:murein L,D-transpeptidase YcbB/YkuD
MRIVGGQVTQAPGPRTPLGKVKFAFDNPYSVYLHDTNAPDLFDRTERFLSHGCVRVEQALDLARRLLAGDPDWPEPRIAETVAAGKTLRVDLKRPIPVHIVYDTAWVEADGTVNFRPDVYGRDLTATAALPAPGGNACGG